MNTIHVQVATGHRPVQLYLNGQPRDIVLAGPPRVLILKAGELIGFSPVGHPEPQVSVQVAATEALPRKADIDRIADLEREAAASAEEKRQLQASVEALEKAVADLSKGD